MTWTAFAVNLIFAWLLLFINGKIGSWKQSDSSLFGYSEFEFKDITEENFSDNFFQLLIHPAIYLAIISWILQLLSLDAIVHTLWLMVPLYWALRLIVAVFRDTLCFLNWRFQVVLFLVSLLLSEGTLFLIILPLLEKKQTVFINLEQFRDAFWFAVFCFLAKFFWDYAKHKMVGKEVFPSSKKANVITRRYNKYHKKYNQFIGKSIASECVFKSSKQREHFSCLIYAIMIYEDHNRPIYLRAIEYTVKLFCPNRLMSLGIMQVQTKTLMSSKTSIICAIKMLYNSFSTCEGICAIGESIHNYNPSASYYDEVIAIYHEIVQHIGLTVYGRQKVKVKKRSFSLKQAFIASRSPTGQ